VSIEEPFSILPLCHICSTIQRNVQELHSATAAGAAGAANAGTVAAPAGHVPGTSNSTGGTPLWCGQSSSGGGLRTDAASLTPDGLVTAACRAAPGQALLVASQQS